MYSIIEGRDFALQGGKPGFTIKDGSGTKWVPIDTNTFDKAELDKLTTDYVRRRGSTQIEKDKQAHREAKAKQDAARIPQAPSPTPSPSPASSTPSSETSTSTPSPSPEPSKPPSSRSTPIPVPQAPKTSSATTSTADKIKGGMDVYKQQVKSGDVKGAEETGKATWALANPKLAAAAAERERTRGTSATTNPLMKDIKSRLPAPKSIETSPPTSRTSSSDIVKPEEIRKKAAVASVKTTTAPLTTIRSSFQYDAYDLVLEYLLSQGHVDTLDEALYVMMEMDSKMIGSIVEQDLTARQEYLIKKVGDMNAAKSGSAHTAISGKQSAGAALDRANRSAMQVRGV